MSGGEPAGVKPSLLLVVTMGVLVLEGGTTKGPEDPDGTTSCADRDMPLVAVSPNVRLLKGSEKRYRCRLVYTIVV